MKALQPDHAIEQAMERTESPRSVGASGRVLRRTVSNVVSGLPTEDTIFGYDGPGDSPAYSEAAAWGPSTT